MILTTTDHGARAEFTCFSVGFGFRLGRRQEDGSDEEHQATQRGNYPGNPPNPEAEWQDHQGSAKTAQKEPENRPGILAALEFEQQGEAVDDKKSSGSSVVTKTLKNAGVGRRSYGAGCRTHGFSADILLYCASRAALIAGSIQELIDDPVGANEHAGASSCSLASIPGQDAIDEDLIDAG